LPFVYVVGLGCFALIHEGVHESRHFLSHYDV